MARHRGFDSRSREAHRDDEPVDVGEGTSTSLGSFLRGMDVLCTSHPLFIFRSAYDMALSTIEYVVMAPAIVTLGTCTIPIFATT